MTMANCRSHMPSRPLGKRKSLLPTTMAAHRSDAGTASSEMHRLSCRRAPSPAGAPGDNRAGATRSSGMVSEPGAGAGDVSGLRRAPCRLL